MGFSMKQIIDLHTHLDTLNYALRLRGRQQNHFLQLQDHVVSERKTILSASIYVNFYRNYEFLKNMIINFKKQIASLGDEALLITQKSDLKKDFKLGIVLHIESARTIKQFENQLPELFDLGVRGVIPVHFVDNHLGSTCDDPFRRLNLKQQDLGITKEGERFVSLCNKLGIWIDLTHTTDVTGDDMLELADKVMVSHVGIRELNSLLRNKSLSFLKKVAQKQGVFGLSPWTHLIGAKTSAIEHHYQFAISNGLQQNICIGTDFGAPIGTSTNITSIFDIENLIGDERFLYKNALGYLERSLPN